MVQSVNVVIGWLPEFTLSLRQYDRYCMLRRAAGLPADDIDAVLLHADTHRSDALLVQAVREVPDDGRLVVTTVELPRGVTWCVQVSPFTGSDCVYLLAAYEPDMTADECRAALVALTSDAPVVRLGNHP
jgi:hypothetical protein